MAKKNFFVGIIAVFLSVITVWSVFASESLQLRGSNGVTYHVSVALRGRSNDISQWKFDTDLDVRQMDTPGFLKVYDIDPTRIEVEIVQKALGNIDPPRKGEYYTVQFTSDRGVSVVFYCYFTSSNNDFTYRSVAMARDR
jgi:hypothetical protein